MSETNSKLLEVSKLTMEFGGLRAIDKVDLDVQTNEIVALIGPNGAGKTTFFNCITGIYKPTAGDVIIRPPDQNQERINDLKPHVITRKGMARTFQNIRLFANMTVLENVMVGRHCRTRAGVLHSLLRTSFQQAEEQKIVSDSYELLKIMELEQYADYLAVNLPYAAQRRLEIARALATKPFLLLLDEPAAGMNPQETLALDELITQLREDFQISILLIEHDMKLVMSISDRIFVVDYGKKIAEGTPDDIQNHPAVIKAYLGEDMDVSC